VGSGSTLVVPRSFGGYIVVAGSYDGPADAAPYFVGCWTVATVGSRPGLGNDGNGMPL
jgi:hypothetical protein